MSPKPTYEELEQRVNELESSRISELMLSKETLQKRTEELIVLNKLGRELILTRTLEQACTVGLKGIASARHGLFSAERIRAQSPPTASSRALESSARPTSASV